MLLEVMTHSPELSTFQLQPVEERLQACPLQSLNSKKRFLIGSGVVGRQRMGFPEQNVDWLTAVRCACPDLRLCVERPDGSVHKCGSGGSSAWCWSGERAQKGGAGQTQCVYKAYLTFCLVGQALRGTACQPSQLPWSSRVSTL